MAEVFIKRVDAELSIGQFVVNPVQGTVKIRGSEDFLVSPERFGDQAPAAAALFAQAYKYGQNNIKRKLQKLTSL